MVVTVVLWASAFVAIRHLGEDFAPGSMALGRLAVGALALGAVAWRAHRRTPLARPTGPQWRALVLIGLLWYALYMVALNEGERRVDAGTAALLIQISPVLIAVLAALVLDEPFTRRLGLGLALAFAGVAVIALGGRAGEAGDPAAALDVVGVLLCLVSAAAYAVSLVVQKTLAARLPAVQVTWVACTIGALALLPFAPALVNDLRAAPASSIWWLVYLGLFPTAVAFTTYAVALQHLTASRLGVTTYAVPVVTIVLSAVLLGEAPPAVAYLGGALALVGVAVARRS